MKKVTKTIAILSIALCINTVAVAQKIAHIQLDSLVSIMPESKKAEELIKNYGAQLEKEIGAMQTEFQTKLNDYQTNAATYSDLVKKNKEEELQMLQQRIEAFREQAGQEYQKKSAELSKPIYEKAKKGIEAVAKEGGYKYVLDTSTGIVLYSEASDDILPLVKKKLETMPEAVLPGAPVNNGGTGTTPPKTNTPPKTGK